MAFFLREAQKLVEPLVSEIFLWQKKFMFGMISVYFKSGHLEVEFRAKIGTRNAHIHMIDLKLT